MPRILLSRLRRDERGYTLVEQLVVCGLLSIILAAILGLSEVATKLAPQDRERVHAVHDAQVALDRMTRELREAHANITVQPFRMSATVRTSSGNSTIVYDCSAAPVDGLRKCTRQQDGGAAVTAIERVANADNRHVFTAQLRDGQTTYVKTLLEVPLRGERTAGSTKRVVLEDGFYLRNIDALN